jgi:HAE1 family hydrophobic/amphiphilic exporter-1
MLTLALAVTSPAVVAQAAPTPIPTAQPLTSPGPRDTSTLILPAVPAVAPIIDDKNAALPTGSIAGIEQLPFVGLTLSDAITMALARNTDLTVAAENRRIAGAQVLQARGPYDVRFQVVPSYTYQTLVTNNPFGTGPDGAPVTTNTFGTNAGFSTQTESGTGIGLNVFGQRTNSNTVFQTFNPFYETGINLNFSQPLLRGAGFSETRRQLQIARINQTISTESALQTASSTLVNVLDTYYDLIAAWRQVAIEEDGLRQSKAQSESNARLVKQGAAAPVDVVESDAQVDIFQDNVYSALQNVARLQYQLKMLILANPADPVWRANLVPVSAATTLPAEPSMSDLVAAALKQRPEVAQLTQSANQSNVNLAYAKGQLKPQLDLQGTAGYNGYAGINTNLVLPGFNLPPVPANQNGKLGQAWNSLFAKQYPTVQLQATLAFPLQNSGARGAYNAALEQQRSVQTQQLALVQRIQAEAGNALQQYRAARSRLVAARAAREASERVLLGEQRRFTAGQSTTFLVLQRQIEVANQRGRELQAQTDLEKAVVELDRVSGNIFGRYNVDVAKLGMGLPAGS